MSTEPETSKPAKTAKKQRGVPFKPGESGNPHGRPRKGCDLAGIMRDYLNGEIDTENGKLTRGEAFIRACYVRAMKGGEGASTKIWHYIEGMPIQRVQADITDHKDPFDGMSTDELRRILKKSKNDKR